MPLAPPPAHVAHAPARERPAIIGGSISSIRALPWLAFINGQFPDGSGESCSGTVLAPRLVLTAGHCAEDIVTGAGYPARDLQVTTGASDVAGSGGRASAVTRTIIDPGYAPPDEADDAALLVLARPTAAPAITLASSAPATGTAAIVAGWGQTRAGSDAIPTVLRTAPADVLDPAGCEQVWAGGFDPASELCTLDQATESAGACSGDSGGPLLSDQDGSTVELGLAIFVATGCATTLPDVYTAADAIAPWVTAQIAAVEPGSGHSGGSAGSAGSGRPGRSGRSGDPRAADDGSATGRRPADQAAAVSRAVLRRAVRDAVRDGRRARRWLTR